MGTAVVGYGAGPPTGSEAGAEGTCFMVLVMVLVVGGGGMEEEDRTQ